MMRKLRFLLALWLGKCARLALRVLKRNATYFPGVVALKICPDFLGQVGKPEIIIAVTGTNGKTTVSNLIADVLTDRGHKVLSNRLGSNVAAGIATTLLSGSSLSGKARYKTAVLEIDERSSKRIYPYLKPKLLVITNLFRDSIMRNAHPEYIASFIEQAVPRETKLVLNADDLISSRIAPENERVYFAVDRMDTDVVECVNLINDLQICPICSGELVYDYRRYHHIGRARCRDCDFKSPEPDYLGTDVDTAAMTMTVTDKQGGRAVYPLLSDSVFNIYNVVTVAAALHEFGLSHEEIAGSLRRTKIVETRYNARQAGNVRVVMQMSKDKNALAGSRAFDYISQLPGEKEIILMMNCMEDQKKWSENTTWLYDCDFEFLAREGITRIVCTGPRAKDYYLRLLIAGVPEEKLRCTMSELDAPDLLAYNPGESVCLFYGTDALDLVYKVQAKIIRCAEEAAAK